MTNTPHTGSNKSKGHTKLYDQLKHAFCNTIPTLQEKLLLLKNKFLSIAIQNYIFFNILVSFNFSRTEHTSSLFKRD